MTKNKVNNFRSCFDVIGPIMIGPSSSHTAGALQIGLLARNLLGNTPTSVRCIYYESFAQTHKGHGTDFAIIGGVLGFSAHDERVPHSIELANQLGIQIEFIEKNSASPVNHSNTVDLTLSDECHSIRLIGISVGGGTVEVKYIKIDGVSIHLNGPLPIILEKTTTNTPSKLPPLLEAQHMLVSHFQKIEHPSNDEKFHVYELQTLFSPTFLEELLLLQKQGAIYILH